jgi:hypothetical protein
VARRPTERNRRPIAHVSTVCLHDRLVCLSVVIVGHRYLSLVRPPHGMPLHSVSGQHLEMENRTEAVNRRAPTHAVCRSRYLLALLSMLCLFVVG